MFFSTLSLFVGWSRTLKVQKANCQTVPSYPVRFSTDIIKNNNILFLFFFLGFFCFSIFFSFFCCLFPCVWVCFYLLKQKIRILTHIRLCGRVSNKKFFTRPETRQLFLDLTGNFSSVKQLNFKDKVSVLENFAQRKRLWQRYFPVNLRILRTAFFKNCCEQLLLGILATSS